IKTGQRKVQTAPMDTLDKVETWLAQVAGLSLKGIQTQTSFGVLSLHELMALTPSVDLAALLTNLDPIYQWPPFMAAFNIDDLKQQLLWITGLSLRLQQFVALESFVGKVKHATDFRDKEFGAWKFVDGLVNYLSDAKGGLFELIFGTLQDWPGSEVV